MSDHDEIAHVLDQVVPIGDHPRQDELAASVARHVSNRPPAPRNSGPGPEILQALVDRSDLRGADEPLPTFECSPLTVGVDFNELLDRLGEPDVWVVLGKLKDLFSNGATP